MQRADDERNDDDSEENVADQHSVVDHPNCAFATEWGVDSPDQNFMQHVGDQKNDRDKKRGSHANPMGDFAVLHDANKPGGEKHRGGTVQSGIDGGQIGDSQECGKL